MKILVLVNHGFEEYAMDDAREILSPKIQTAFVAKGIITIDVDDYIMACKYVYNSQIALRVLILLHANNDPDIVREILTGELPNDEFQTPIKDGLSKSLKEISPIMPTIRYRASVINETTEVLDNSLLEKLFGIIIYDNITGLDVDLKNPEIIFYMIVSSDNVFFGLDISGDLSRRDYRIFNNPMSIKGTTAYGVLRMCEFNKGETLLDPYCNSGTIPIEAALYSRSISHKRFNKDIPFTKLNIFGEKKLEDFFKYEDKEDKSVIASETIITAADPLLKNITAAKKNAKIAGVEKMMDFRRIDIDWMDIKHEEKHFDKIITFMPGSSKHKNLTVLEKEFKEFFYQAEYIIEDDGVLCVLCLSKDLLINASTQYFVIDKIKEFYSGEQLMYVIIFRKKKH